MCAASSVAGAWNTVLHHTRACEGAETQDSALDALRYIVSEQVRKAKESLMRALLVTSLDDLLEVVAKGAAETGRSIEGRKAMGVNKKECIVFLRKHCMDVAFERGTPEVGPEGPGMPENAVDSLIDVWQLTRESVEEYRQKLAAEEAAEAAKKEAPEEPAPARVKVENYCVGEELEMGSDDNDDDDAEEETTTDDKKKKKKKSSKPATKSLLQIVHTSLSKWLRSTIALAKLNRAEAPSTAGIGNWGIPQATQIFSEKTGKSVKVKGLMGRGSVLHKTKVADDAPTITKQWNALRDAFSAPNSAVLFHLTNHYALVFAMRSWTTPEGVHEREILTARRGQRPNTWIPFDDCRAILTGWSGYMMFHVYSTPKQSEETPEDDKEEKDKEAEKEEKEANEDKNEKDEKKDGTADPVTPTA